MDDFRNLKCVSSRQNIEPFAPEEIDEIDAETWFSLREYSDSQLFEDLVVRHSDQNFYIVEELDANNQVLGESFFLSAEVMEEHVHKRLLEIQQASFDKTVVLLKSLFNFMQLVSVPYTERLRMQAKFRGVRYPVSDTETQRKVAEKRIKPRTRNNETRPSRAGVRVLYDD